VTDFALLDTGGKQCDLRTCRGKPVVLNFWAFWCDTWKEELPHLQELAGRQKEIGFSLLSISVDGMRLKEFQGRVRHPLPFPVLLDVGGRVSRDYRVGHVPTVLILDSSGQVR